MAQVTLTDGYVLDDDIARIDIDAVHAFITSAYWSAGRTRALVERSIGRSICVAVYRDDALCAFARMVTDGVAVAHILDVFVLKAHRGRGLSKQMVKFLLDHPDIATVRRITLNTSDAHGLYAQFGFTPFSQPEYAMELLRQR